MVHIPVEFSVATIAREGEAGAAWIDELPGVVDQLMERWGCEPDGEVRHGQVGVVVPVRVGGAEMVVKVSFPHPGNVHEPDAFEVWGGRGAVRMMRRADEKFAMLLERVRDENLSGEQDFDTAVTVLGALSRQLAVPAPPNLPRLTDHIAGWVAEIQSDAAELGNPLPKSVLTAAVVTVGELGSSQPEVMVHGDLHDTNVLAAEREAWLVVDPKGYVGDPAYDAITVVRSVRFLPLLNTPNPRRAVQRGLDIYCEAAGIESGRARRWAQLGAVRGSLWGRRYGDPDWIIAASDDLAEILTD